jgi:hypothetical protein
MVPSVQRERLADKVAIAGQAISVNGGEWFGK